jgi:glycosyltransferase involved in cell wall biosynthesis
VVKTSEMLATDDNNGRLLRSGMVAHMLDARGHEVTWWMSTFDHANRRSRAPSSLAVPFGTQGSIRMVHSPGYRESISLARLRDHAIWGRAFRAAVAAAPRPDVIFCAYPTIEAAAVCTAYGQQQQVPVVLDLRDMWPDIFGEIAPAALRPLARAVLAPWRRQARTALRGATALFAITEEFLSWGLGVAGRERREADAAFRLAFPQVPSTEDPAALAKAAEFWDQQRVSRAGSFNVVLVGSMTERRFEMDAVIKAARDLQHGAGRVKFILAGDGDDLAKYRELARDCSNVLFPGWLSAFQIRELLNRAHLGLVPYRNAPDYMMSVPNKVGEYLAAGLPIASCLTGTLERLLRARRCGLQFEARDPATLAAAIRELAADEPLRLALSSAARDTYREELVAETVYGRLIDRLEALAAAAKRNE